MTDHGGESRNGGGDRSSHAHDHAGGAGGPRRRPGDRDHSGDGTHERVRSGGRREDEDSGDDNRTSDTSEDDKPEITRISVPEMDCPSCAGKVAAALEAVDGVRDCETRPTTGAVVVTHGSSAVTDGDLTAAIEGAGYTVPAGAGDERPGDREGDRDTGERGALWTSRRAVMAATSGVFVGLGVLVEIVTTHGAVVSGLGTTLHAADLLFLAAVVTGGTEILRNGYYSARAVHLDIDVLMSAAILGALFVSLIFGEALYFEAATLAFLFSVAELLERYSMDRARGSLRELMDLSPTTATVRRAGETETVPVDEVGVGEVVVVKPGEKLPADGVVLEGESTINRAPITGESVPVDTTIGDEVYAGTVNEAGYLEVEVTAAADESTLSQVVARVEQAQSSTTEREQFVERFAAYYTPAVVVSAGLTTVGMPVVFGTSWSTAVVYGLTLLVLACPCAFVISTPVSVVSGVTSAAQNGVLIKQGRHLEAMGAVDVVAFDKTGTLTTGELAVTDVIPLGGNSKSDVLRCARGLEQRSEHPIGEAIVEAAGRAGVTERERVVEGFESITGKGVQAALDGQQHFAGKPGLFDELGFDLSHVHATTTAGDATETAQQLCDQHSCLDLLEETVPRLQAEGKTVVLVGTADELEGVIAVADGLRPAAEQTLTRLEQLGVSRTVMLTGDSERTAGAIAAQVGVDEFRAGLLPEQKVAAVEELSEDGSTVAMIGDGINDGPALATATVGIAMGAAGTDTALETADIALLGDDLRRLPYLYTLAHDANSVIRQNIWASLAVKAGLAVAVPFGYVPIWLAVLAGDAGMTTAVTGNAMRLARITPATDVDPTTQEA